MELNLALIVKINHQKWSLTNQRCGYGNCDSSRERYREDGLNFWWSSEVHSGWLSANEGHSQMQGNAGKLMCCRFTCDYATECATVALRGPEPSGARGLQQTSAPCERVLTSCNRKCDHRGHPATDAEHEKNALGVEMSCEQLGSTTEHLRGVIDSLSMLLKARGSFKLCWFFCCCCFFPLSCWCLRPQFLKILEVDRQQWTFRGRLAC